MAGLCFADRLRDLMQPTEFIQTTIQQANSRLQRVSPLESALRLRAEEKMHSVSPHVYIISLYDNHSHNHVRP